MLSPSCLYGYRHANPHTWQRLHTVVCEQTLNVYLYIQYNVLLKPGTENHHHTPKMQMQMQFMMSVR